MESKSESPYAVFPLEDDPEGARTRLAAALVLMGFIALIGFVISALIFEMWAFGLWGAIGSLALAAIATTLFAHSAGTGTPPR
jgi:hypothetical protein